MRGGKFSARRFYCIVRSTHSTFRYPSSQGQQGRTAVLNIVMQLRKCAGHPYLFPGQEDRTLPPLGPHLIENCGKMVLLDKLLKRLKER